MKFLRIGYAGLILVIGLQFVQAQTKITAIGRGETPLEETADIKCIRFADFSEEIVKLEMELKAGDLLVSSSGNTNMEIMRGETSRMIFSNRFRVVIMTEKSETMAVNLLDGNVDVQSEVPTSVQSGETLLGSGHTEYAVRTYRKNRGAVQEFIVYEGNISVDADTLYKGEKLEKGKPIRSEVSETDITLTSYFYAQMDFAKASYAAPTPIGRDKFLQLKTLYKTVLMDPENPDNRQELATQQNEMQIPAQALYNLTQAEKRVSNKDSAKLAQIYIDKSISYEKLDQPKMASKLLKKAELLTRDIRSINPNVNRDLLNQLKERREREESEKLFQLMEEGKWRQALEGFEKRIENQEATSIDYYWAAICYYKLGVEESASTYAKKALRITREDRKLTNEQIEMCKRMAPY